MYYEPISGQEFATIHAFKLAYPNTSFGELGSEVERNAIGLYQINDVLPVFDQKTQDVTPEGVEHRDGMYYRDYTLRELDVQETRARLPAVCTPAQGLVALFAIKQITEQDVVTAIAAIPDPVQRYMAQIGFHRATAWERGSATMQAMAALLSLSETDLDALFSYAAGVQV